MKHFKKLLMGVALAAVVPISAAAECSYPNYTHGGRNLTSFTLTDGNESAKFNVGQTTTSGRSVYFDLTTSDPLQTVPGATVKFSELTWSGEWMHGYLYIDYNDDGQYDTVLNRTGDTGGELVSYSYYEGKNSAGSSASADVGLGNGNGATGASKMPEFIIPSNIGSGLHKALFKVDWNSLDPCGNPESGNGIGKNGGAAVEFYIDITNPTPMEIVSTTAQSYTGNTKAGAEVVVIASFNIKTTGTLEPMSLNAVTADYTGTTPADVKKLRWVYSRTSAMGSSSVSSLESASSKMTFDFDQELASGDNYFVLVADIVDDANINDIINVKLDKITVNGKSIAFTPAEDKGGLKVVNEIDYTTGNALWFNTPTAFTNTNIWNRNDFSTANDNPDQIWERQSFPIGNGSFGGNVLGSVATERVVLNEKTLWKGGPGVGASKYWDMNHNVSDATLKQIRTYLEKGQNAQANSLVQSNYYGNVNYTKDVFGTYTTMGEAYVATGINGSTTDYKRILNMDKSLVVVQFKSNGVDYLRKYFVSYPDNVMVWNYTSTGGTQDLTFSFSCPQTVNSVEAVEGGLLYNCSIANNGMQWAMRVYARVNGAGTVNVNQASRTITVSGATDVDFILAADTDYKMNFHPSYTDPKTFVGENPVANVNAWIDAAKARSYDELYARHYDDYSKLYGRTELVINPDKLFSNLPTPTRLANYRSGTLDHVLEQQYFQYGRYLLISSSREGTMPANLQGMWHNNIDGPWRVDYHNNINLQMNYWPATSTNLLECFTPFIDYVRGLVEPGKRTAQAYYGARGWTAEVSTNIFGFTAPLNSTDMSWNYNPTAGPWLATQIWEYYDYTRDKKWLKDVGYDIIKQSADFCSDLLYMVNGTYTSAPSYSPEHGTADLGATYANAVTREILIDAIKAATILDVDESSVDEWKEKLENMYPYKVGKYKQLQEWYEDIDQYGDTHRHTNHLFGLHPGSTINAITDKTLADACKETLNQRGDAATGWSMGWKLNHWARLLDGDHAYTLFKNLLKNGTADNMWDLHPPFQIDGNFGGTAGIAELFLQSHNGFLHLLPALPSDWTNGQITGLLARGNFEVDIYYNENKLDHATIRSNVGEPCKVYYKGKEIDFETVAGGEYEITVDAQGNLAVDHVGTAGDINIGNVTLTTQPEENPTEVVIRATNVTVAESLEGATVNVSYSLNDGEYVAMDYVKSNDSYDATVFFETLTPGDYKVTVKATATLNGKVVAQVVKDGGKFTVQKSSGITDAASEVEKEARYFNLQGVEVTNPGPGLYICVRGNEATKILVE